MHDLVEQARSVRLRTFQVTSFATDMETCLFMRAWVAAAQACSWGDCGSCTQWEAGKEANGSNRGRLKLAARRKSQLVMVGVTLSQSEY